MAEVEQQDHHEAVAETPVAVEEQTTPVAVSEESPAVEVAAPYQKNDVFEWANAVSQFKNEVQFELFLISKKKIPYRMTVDAELTKRLESLFVNKLVEGVLMGAGTGMVVREFEDGEDEDHVLQRVDIVKVDKLNELFQWFRVQQHEIEQFVEAEHDIKRMQAVVARCSHKSMKKDWYVIKQLPSSATMKGSTDWMLRNGTFVPFDAEGSLRIPPDNQLLVIERDVFAFNPSKLDRLFGYNAKKYLIAQQKIEEIGKRFHLSFDEGLSLEKLVQGKKALVNKLQRLELGDMTQKDVLKQAEELDIELITDSKDAIIIMVEADMVQFINLLNDDYVESGLTGNRYEIKSKKPLKSDDEEDKK